MTAKNTDKVPVTEEMEELTRSTIESYGTHDAIVLAINASPELTALIAENEQLTLDNKRMREQLRLTSSTEDQQNETILHLQTAKRQPSLCKFWENDPFGDIYCNDRNEFIKYLDPCPCFNCPSYKLRKM